ncbi:MFS transporter [Collinsella sp. An2]|uniref:MFS transporter n=1 Tax=Collinsella sp. An2 TaxID=1965585 RepID=UPI000B38F7B1|nr:MFS transporter [Collinsella sp. An2]OUP11076.1 sugar transporter [Collinsella sp. An2]
MWLPLVGLAFAAFMFNTSEFMPVGLLTDIAGSFALSEAQAGMMISIYAWAVMALSLPLMILGSKLPMRTLLLVVIAVFLTGQAASAAAPTFPLLVAARLLVAAAHAVFWSIASPLATRIADDQHASTAMSMVVTGSSVAMIFGMPLGRVIGLAVGWRMTFACVGAVALCVLLLMMAVMPRLEKGEPFTLAQLPGLLQNRSLMAIYAVTILAATGYYTGYSYIEPFLQQIAGLADGTITAALMVFGCAGIVGSLLFSRFYDGHRVGFSRIMIAGLSLALLLMVATGVSPAAVFGICFIWGLSATAFNVAFQAEIIHATPPDASAVAMSIFSGLFNLGIGCGTWFGGMVTDSVGIGSVGLVGGAIAAVALVVCCATMGGRRRSVEATLR